jgi:hypothetical protein
MTRWTAEIRQKVAVRLSSDVLAGLVGEHPHDRKNELVAREDCERMNAVLRFLFSAVIIDEHRGLIDRLRRMRE